MKRWAYHSQRHNTMKQPSTEPISRKRNDKLYIPTINPKCPNAQANLHSGGGSVARKKQTNSWLGINCVFIPRPTPGGVPVVIISPGIKVIKLLKCEIKKLKLNIVSLFSHKNLLFVIYARRSCWMLQRRAAALRRSGRPLLWTAFFQSLHLIEEKSCGIQQLCINF